MMVPIFLMCVALAAAAPSTGSKLVITEEFYPEQLVMYTGKYDIVDIVVPLNDLNQVFKEDSDEVSDEHLSYVFFVEGEMRDGAVQSYHGVYVFKNGKAKMVLQNGQSVTYGPGKTVYIGASDGIYKYNYEDDSVTKYGSFSGSIIRIARDTFHSTYYYLTSDYVFYKFAEGETTATKFDAIKDVRDFVFDYDGHMFYYDSHYVFYVYKDNHSFKIEGLPATPTKAYLIRAPLMLKELYAVIDGYLYEMNKDAKSEKSDIQFQAFPTAFAPDATLIEFYAYNKKIYEYNLVALLQNAIVDDLKTFFAENEEEIKVISKTKPKF